MSPKVKFFINRYTTIAFIVTIIACIVTSFVGVIAAGQSISSFMLVLILFTLFLRMYTYFYRGILLEEIGRRRSPLRVFAPGSYDYQIKEYVDFFYSRGGVKGYFVRVAKENKTSFTFFKELYYVASSRDNLEDEVFDLAAQNPAAARKVIEKIEIDACTTRWSAESKKRQVERLELVNELLKEKKK